MLNYLCIVIEHKIILHKSKVPIFDQYYGLDDQINKIIRPKVWLKSGAHLIIEHTEAMVVIDVNSGKKVDKKKDQETNALEVNLDVRSALTGLANAPTPATINKGINFFMLRNNFLHSIYTSSYC